MTHTLVSRFCCQRRYLTWPNSFLAGDRGMTDKPTMTSRCRFCGFWFPPNHSGPCPNCGRESTYITAYSDQMVNLGKTLKIPDVVNASGATTFVAHNIQTPDWWPEVAQDITKTLEAKIPEVLYQFENAKEAKEKRLSRRMWKFSEILFWIVVGAVIGAILTPMIARLIGT